MATSVFDATETTNVTIGNSSTTFEDITFSQGTGETGEPSQTSLVISFGEDSIILTKYFTEIIDGDETTFEVAENVTQIFNVGGKDYNLMWHYSNVFAQGSSYAGDNISYGDGGAMYNIINGTSNNQNITAIKGIRNWINGGEGSQNITGANEFDMLAGNEDNDTIKASSSNATEIYGGEGNDSLTGSNTADWIAGNEGSDTIRGGDGDDWLLGGDHRLDSVPDGADTIYGGNGNDSIYGCAGNDKLYGESGNDKINGGAGNDYIDGGIGNDTLTGGDGYDTFVFNKNYGNDVIVDATSDDIITFNKSIRYNDVTFSQGTGLTDSKPITSLLINYGGNNTIEVQNYFTAENVVNSNAIDSFEIGGNDYSLEWTSINGSDYGMYSVTNAQNYESPNGVTGIKINSKNGNEIIRGSQYNDTLNIKAGNNDISETAGTNKITTGKGNDTISVSGYSSNTIKAGSGINNITLDSVGTNKVTAGNGVDIVTITAGSNNIKLGNGKNILTIGDELIPTGTSVNTVSTGKNEDTFTVYSGNNNIKSGSGDDDFIISGGYNTVNSGNGESEFVISGGSNQIKSGKNDDEYIISDGLNTISAGSGEDTFVVSGGNNNLSGNNGVDLFKVTDEGILDSSASTLIATYLNGGKGNDIYNIDKSAYENSLINITDTSGKNSLIVNEQLDVYFNVTLGKKGKYSIGKEVIFTDSFDSDDDGIFDIDSLDTGISVTGKNYKSIATVAVSNETSSTVYAFDITTLASDVAGWLAANNFASSDAVLLSGNDTAIDALLGVYAGTTEYTGSSQCYTGAGVA